MIEQLVTEYGYLAILLGTFLEGETVLVLGGFAAHQEYLRLPLVILVAFVGSFSSDQLWFYLARKHGRSWLQQRPSMQRKFAQVSRLLESHPTLFILSFRFVYGIRNMAPAAIALSSVPTGKFVLLNAVSAALWAVIGASAGYVFGNAIETALGDLGRIEERALAAGILALVTYLGFRYMRRRASRTQGQ